MKIEIGSPDIKTTNAVFQWITKMLSEHLKDCPIVLSEIEIEIYGDCPK